MEPDEILKLRAALRSVTDYLDDLLSEGKFSPKGRSVDDKDAMVGWWDDRFAAINSARNVLAETES